MDTTTQSRRSDGLAWLAAALTAAGGVVHLVMVPVHAGGTLTDPLLFALAAWAQLGLAAVLVRRVPGRAIWAATAIGNAALVAVWAWSRTRGLPWGDHAGEVEPVATVDAFTAIAEGLAAVAGTAGIALGARARLPRPVGAVAAAAVLALTTAVAVAPSTAEHAHGAAGHTHGDTQSSQALDMATIDQTRCDRAFNPAAYWTETRTLGVDTYAGGAVTADTTAAGHVHSTTTDGLLAAVARPEALDGRGSPGLDRLVAATDAALTGEGAAAALVERLSRASDEDYDAWLVWLRASGIVSHSHGASGDDAAGHGGHVGPQAWTAMADARRCDALGEELGRARDVALRYPTVADAEAAGWTKVTDYVPGIAAHYINGTLVDDRFELERPEMLLYDGTAPGSHVVGLSYYLVHPGTSEPTQGFSGGNDHFHRHVGLCYRNSDGVVIGDSTTTAQRCAELGGYKGGGQDGWMSHAWVVPGCESPWGVFSAANPLLDRELTRRSGADGGGCAGSHARARYDLRAGAA